MLIEIGCWGSVIFNDLWLLLNYGETIVVAFLFAVTMKESYKWIMAPQESFLGIYFNIH